MHYSNDFDMAVLWPAKSSMPLYDYLVSVKMSVCYISFSGGFQDKFVYSRMFSPKFQNDITIL